MAFDFSQHRWQADCRELSNEEKDAFLLALENAFKGMRWRSRCRPSEWKFYSDALFFSYSKNWSALSSGDFDHDFTDPLATASDVREFIAATLSAQPAEPDSKANSDLAHDEITETLAQRGECYGKFNEFSSICQQLKNTAHSAPKWDAMPDDCREAVDMILHKVARALNGDPNYADNWHDIQGYA